MSNSRKMSTGQALLMFVITFIINIVVILLFNYFTNETEPITRLLFGATFTSVVLVVAFYFLGSFDKKKQD